jgi:hypothetical protein
MCVVACKYIENLGWVIGKNRDRNYKPIIKIRKSFRNNIERLYIWDKRTKYTEGINEFGVGIVSASVTVKEDEAEGKLALKKPKSKDIKTKKRIFYSPDGIRIRTALFEKTAADAARKLIELEIPGNTIIADKERCFLLEGAFIDSEYVYKIVEVPQNKIAVRTNHGIFLPWAGYSTEIESQKDKRKSSEIRYSKTVENIKKSNNLEEFLDALSEFSNPEEPQMNPLRLDTDRTSMRTTGQLILVPNEHTLHYRAVWCETLFDLDKLNTKEEKTFFEVISARKLITFKKFNNI